MITLSLDCDCVTATEPNNTLVPYICKAVDKSDL
jgi:hypothetical protein